MYRVRREGEYIRVYRLDKPDLAGNALWVVVATLLENDMTEDGRRVGDLQDAEILRLVTGQ